MKDSDDQCPNSDYDLGNVPLFSVIYFPEEGTGTITDARYSGSIGN